MQGDEASADALQSLQALQAPLLKIEFHHFVSFVFLSGGLSSFGGNLIRLPIAVRRLQILLIVHSDRFD